MIPLDHRPDADGETIGRLIARLVEDAKQFVRAEIEYYRLLVTSRVAGLKVAVVLIVVAILLAQAALTTLLIGIGLAVARLFARLGPAGGIVVAAVTGLAISGVLARIAIGRVAAAGRAAGVK